MPDTRSAREEILTRIQNTTFVNPDAEGRVRECNSIDRRFRRVGTLNDNQRIDLLTDRLVDYGAGVRCASGQELQSVIAEVLRARDRKRIIVPNAWPEAWTPKEPEVMRDHGLTYEALDQCEGIMTASTLAIALTGTIVLQGSPLEGRRALTLIPDYHLCIVRADQIVELVPEAIERLGSAASKPLTFISGPSATADIEMNRVQGVHGPRVLDVVILR